MQIEGDVVTIYSLLNDPKPDGLGVEKSGGDATKAFDLSININVDLLAIPAYAAVSWILARIHARSKIKVNGKLLPPDDAEARKMIMDAIDEDQKENQDRKE